MEFQRQVSVAKRYGSAWNVDNEVSVLRLLIPGTNHIRLFGYA